MGLLTRNENEILEKLADGGDEEVVEERNDLPRWEYTTARLAMASHPKSITKTMNRYGAAGWEAVCLTSEHRILFKRPAR